MPMTILITGASRGIGRALAAQYVAEGHKVTGTARRPKAAEDPVCPLIAANVAEPETLAPLAEGPPLDLLICNAGQYLARGPLEDPSQTPLAWHDVLMTNVAGVFFTIRTVIGRLRQAEMPKIAVISSKMGSTSMAPGGSALYRASKAAATNIAVNLAQELRPQGVAVGAYHPGWVRTDMGGGSADISVEESAKGLIARIEALSLARTGVFEDYSGKRLPF